MVEPLVDVAGLAKSYAGRIAVRDVWMVLMPGAMIGLVGANGGGKTTTLRMLAGLIRPDAGTGRVLGRDIGRPSGRVGYMPQRSSLYPELTVAENLRFRGRVHGLPEMEARIAEIAEQWQLAPFLKTRFGRLSGGWSRRVEFAATMLHAPALLLLDEPTAGLDVVTRNQIWTELSDLAARGHGIVISTHDLAEAERCPAIMHYHDGAAHGPMTPAALIAESGEATLEAAVAAIARNGG